MIVVIAIIIDFTIHSVAAMLKLVFVQLQPVVATLDMQLGTMLLRAVGNCI